MRAAIYIRSATGNQAHLRVQTERCAKYAAEHGYTDVEVYEDQAQSGIRDDGVALNRMLSDTSKHYFDAVIIDDVYRLSRRMERVGQISTTLRDLDISLVIVGQTA
jgi:DNA invertase Pin-like site-specific DNA recombinase